MASRLMASRLRVLLSLFLLVLISACAVRAPVDTWPADIPARNYFQKQWRADAANKSVQDREDYLLWVVRFYQGYQLAPGWLDMMEQVNVRVPAEERVQVRAALFELGSIIGGEWAKDNGVRKVSTRSAAVWRDALLESLSQDDLHPYLDKLQQDVEALMSGSLGNDEIVFERYYVDEFDF